MICDALCFVTATAVFEKTREASIQPKTKALTLTALNRFLHSPLKQAHIKRNMYRINLVKKDFLQ